MEPELVQRITSNPNVISAAENLSKPGRKTTEFYSLVFTQLVVAALTIKYAFLTPAGSLLTVFLLPIMSGLVSVAYTFARTHVKVSVIRSAPPPPLPVAPSSPDA